MVTCVILTIPLWEKPHCDEVCNKRRSWQGRTRFPTNFFAICYTDIVKSIRREKLRRDACTVSEGGGGGSGAGIQIEFPEKLQTRRCGQFHHNSRLSIYLCGPDLGCKTSGPT